MLLFLDIRLGHVPPCVYQMNCVRHLYLSNCKLRDDFPVGLVSMRNLETLDLSQNKITVLPDQFCLSAKKLRVSIN